MDIIYNQSNQTVLRTQLCFQKLKRLGANIDEFQVEEEISSNMEELQRNCDRLEVLLRKEPITRRHHSMMKVEQLKHEISYLKGALRSYQNEKIKIQTDRREREELLNRKFTTNNSGDTTILIDHSIQHQQSITRADRGVEDLISSGASILESLQNQRYRLKGAQRRIMDIANTLGLSNTTMKFIERRVKEDKYILFGGMFLTVCIIILIVVFVI